MLPLRYIPFVIVCVLLVLCIVVGLATGSAWAWILAVPAGGLTALGIHDLTQTKHSLLRNYPLLAHGRYFMEAIRPEIRQYFIEDDLTGRPFNREQRSLVYQRAKGESDYDPFGSELNVKDVGYEWIGHSIAASSHHADPPRARVGGPHCTLPYAMSLLNTSAMSFGSLGHNAVRALGRGARKGGYAQHTGEGGISRFHLEEGGDLVWQIGTGYFGCRAEDGTFDAEQFVERATHENVRMIELKLSQGAKPGHGGILPGHKVTEEIAHARGVAVGTDCLSPPGHSAFEDPAGLVAFVDRLRELSGGKPVGIKLCVGLPHEFLAIVKAMAASGSGPDFITVDGGEGGTGAAPVEFCDHVGMPLEEALVFVENALVGAGLRKRVTLIASGKVTSAMDILRLCALGADATNSARAFMMTVGCIQAQVCHTNECPVGVATQDPARNRGLDPIGKGDRAARYHGDTLATLMELCAALGLEDPRACAPARIFRRVAPDEIRTLEEIHAFEGSGSLLDGSASHDLLRAWERARIDTWAPSEPDPPVVSGIS